MRLLYWLFGLLMLVGLPVLAQQAGRIERTPFTALTQDDLDVMVANVQRPNGMIYFNGLLYVICNGDWTIYEIDAETNATVTFVNGSRNAHQLHIEETDAGFNLWIPDFDLNRLTLVTERRNAPRTIASRDLNGPWGIAALDEDTFLISNLKGDNIVKVSREGEVSAFVGGLRSPAGLAVQDDVVFVANNGSARRAIEWLTVDEDGMAGTPQALVSGLQNVSNLVLAADGYLYFTYALGSRGVVGRVLPEACQDEACQTDDVEIVVMTELEAPLAGLTISDEMQLFVHTIYRPELYKVDLERS